MSPIFLLRYVLTYEPLTYPSYLFYKVAYKGPWCRSWDTIPL